MKLTVPVSYRAARRLDGPAIRHFTTAVVEIDQVDSASMVPTATDTLHGIEYSAHGGRLWKPFRRIDYSGGSPSAATSIRAGRPRELSVDRFKKDMRGYRAHMRSKEGMRFETSGIDTVLDIHSLFSAERSVEGRLGRLQTQSFAEALPALDQPGPAFAVEAARAAARHLLVVDDAIHEETPGPTVSADIIGRFGPPDIWTDPQARYVEFAYRWAFHRSREFLEAASQFVDDAHMDAALDRIAAIEIHAPEHMGLVDVAALETERFGWLAMEWMRHSRPRLLGREALQNYAAVRRELVAMARARGIEASTAVESPVFRRDTRSIASRSLGPLLLELSSREELGRSFAPLRNWTVLSPESRATFESDLDDFAI